VQDQFIQTCIHHIITIGLVVLSACSGYHRFGGVIMFVYDYADIPLLSAKGFKYLSKQPDDNFQFIANRLFELFAVVYFMTRTVAYNCIVFVALRDLPMIPSGHVARALLVALDLLQLFWLGLLVQVIIKMQKSGGVVEDIREHQRKKPKTI
jgi:hypothetical protein